MSSGLGNVRILVLEDNQHMRSIISTILSGVGIHDVRESPDSLSAIRIMHEHPVDIAWSISS